ncbi:MAG: ABC transporter permease [Anaerolineae bacterium]|nr:ABC transporter permease [Anaerolineae bacterium]MDW8172687.1 ABC transporter permease [Anaerolineae bacterium]
MSVLSRWRRPLLMPLAPTSGVLLGVLALFVFFSLATPFFFNVNNFINIGQQSAVLAVAAFAMTFIILSGEIDLSMGAVGAIAGVLTAMALRDGLHLPLAVLIGLGTGAMAGLLNGFISMRFGVPSFIVTLGVASIARAISRTITQNRPVSVLDETYLSLFSDARLLGLTINVWYVGLLFVLLYVLLMRTPFGMAVFAVGGNRQAAHLSGIPAARVKVIVFVLAGALVGFAGILQAARLGSARVDPINNLELDAIAAVVLGGTSFSGGRGSLVRTLLGILLIGILNNGLSLMNVDSYWQLVIKGGIVIGAVLLDRWWVTASRSRQPVQDKEKRA